MASPAPQARCWPSAGLLMCMLTCTPALAQTATTTPPTAPPTPAPQTAPHTEPEQQPALYTQALSALAQNQLEQARALLQAVVKQHPELAGAWLDLAVLAARQGQYPEADEYLLALEQKFAPLPPEIGQAVARLRQHLHAQRHATSEPPNPARRQTALVMGAGYESNVNAGLSINTITLTTPDGNAILNVGPASQAQGAAYARLGLLHQIEQTWQGGQLHWQLQGQTRQYSGLSQYNTLELLPQLTLEHPRLTGQITVGWQSIWLHSQGVYQTPIVRWQLDRQLADCNWRHQVQAERRQYLQASHFDSHWLLYRSTWQCQSGAVRRQAYVQLAQENAAHTNRPGGNTRHQSLGLQQEWLNPLGLDGHTLQAKADWLQTQDSGTYNSLLDNGQPRRLHRADAQLSWSAPVVAQPGWRWSVSAQGHTQKSNIAFFSQRNFSLETSIWRAW